MFALVVVPVPVDHPFTYAIPEGLDVPVGARVLVPFGQRRLVGACVGHTATAPKQTAKPILQVLDAEPAFGPGLLELTRWVGSWYLSSWGESLMSALPSPVRRTTARRYENIASLAVPKETALARAAEFRAVNGRWSRVLEALAESDAPVPVSELVERLNISDSPVATLAKRGLVRIERRPVDSVDPILACAPSPAPPPDLNPEQARCVAEIDAARGSFRSFLLFGVTGSGKTEVYLRSIRSCIDSGRKALVLVPEIALTPQTISRFSARFSRLAVLHHRLSDTQRADQWKRAQAGEADVVIGARSAVFAPLPDLGLIVVDEEHEPSYKSGNAPRYHARDVAVKRGQLEQAVVVLGSATPSLESWRNAQEGRYSLLRLDARVASRPLPPVEIVDMAGEAGPKGRTLLLSRKLETAVRDATARGEQSILFLNRRGFAPVVFCAGCKFVQKCGHCDVAMTFHKRRGTVTCHHCGAESSPPAICPACRQPGLKFLGLGTERVEEEVRALFETAGVARMDRDSTRSRDAHARILSGMADGTTDILVGTQMVAKGHDIPGVTVVGIISADTGLQIRDFRAEERTFQLIAQVAGRAGRGDTPGRVFAQTFNPGAPSITFAARHDFESFARKEMAFRREWIWPPFIRLLRLVVGADTPENALRACGACVEASAAILGADASLTLGPEPAAIPFLRDRHRYHAVFRAKSWESLWKVARAGARALEAWKTADAVWDMDAYDMV